MKCMCGKTGENRALATAPPEGVNTILVRVLTIPFPRVIQSGIPGEPIEQK